MTLNKDWHAEEQNEGLYLYVFEVNRPIAGPFAENRHKEAKLIAKLPELFRAAISVRDGWANMTFPPKPHFTSKMAELFAVLKEMEEIK